MSYLSHCGYNCVFSVEEDLAVFLFCVYWLVTAVTASLPACPHTSFLHYGSHHLLSTSLRLAGRQWQASFSLITIAYFQVSKQCGEIWNLWRNCIYRIKDSVILLFTFQALCQCFKFLPRHSVTLDENTSKGML